MELDTNLRVLLENSKEKGYIAESEISKYCSTDEQEMIYEKFKSEGVDVLSNDEFIDYCVSDVEEEEVDALDENIAESVDINDTVRTYLKEIGNIPLLSNEEEVTLAYAISLGRESAVKLREESLNKEEINQLQENIKAAEIAKKKLVESNLRLVVSIAKRYVGRGMPLMDLIQEGSLGLIKAAEKFIPQKGFRFSTYATWWIRQAITRGVADQGRTIRIPVHMVEIINKYLRTQRQMIQILGHEPSVEEIAKEMGIPVDKVHMIQKASQEPISLETKLSEEDDSTLSDFISDPNGVAPDRYTILEIFRRELEDVLSTLNPREEQVIRMRYGLLDGRIRTLEELGLVFGITRERIRQIEDKAIKKLKNPRLIRKLMGYFEVC